MSDIQSEGVKSLSQREHNSDANAKRVVVRVFNSSTGEWENQSPSAGTIVYEQFDYIERALTNSTTETYIYKLGGSGGATVATVTVIYADSTLETISSVART